MSIDLPLAQMTLADKLLAMEALWEDLSSKPGELPSPAWHREVLHERKRLVELGPIGEAYVTELVHQRPHTWKGCIARLFAVLEEIGDARFRLVLQRALMQRLIGAEYLERVLAHVPAVVEVAS